MPRIEDLISFKESPGKFRKLETEIDTGFAEIDTLRVEYSGAEKKLDKEQATLDRFNEENSYLPNDTLSVEYNNTSLVWRKWATVGIDAIISLAAIKLFLMETVNLDIALLPSIIAGVCVAYFLLKLAISYKHYDSEKLEQGKLISLWMRYSYVIPLLIIPCLSLFLILFSPGNPANYIWVCFLVFSFLLNLKAASYSSEYIEMEQISKKNKVQNRYQKRIDSINKEIDEIQAKVLKIITILRPRATDFRREYESYDAANRPELALPIPYRFVLNTRVYYSDVLEIPQPLNITEPPLEGPIGLLRNWLDQATSMPQNYINNIIPEAPERRRIPNNPEPVPETEDPNNEERINPPTQEQQEDAIEDDTFAKPNSDKNKFI
jgi:hypothetical protein